MWEKNDIEKYYAFLLNINIFPQPPEYVLLCFVVLTLKSDQFFYTVDQGGYIWSFLEAVDENVCPNSLLRACIQILCNSLLPQPRPLVFVKWLNEQHFIILLTLTWWPPMDIIFSDSSRAINDSWCQRCSRDPMQSRSNGSITPPIWVLIQIAFSREIQCDIGWPHLKSRVERQLIFLAMWLILPTVLHSKRRR